MELSLVKMAGGLECILRVDDLTATRDGDTEFMACTLHMTSRTTGVTITQPFAEVLRFHDKRRIQGTPFYYDTSEIVLALG